MDEFLTKAQIFERYPSEWVLIGEPQLSESQQFLAGKVLFHGQDRDAVSRKANELPIPRYIGVFFTGPPIDGAIWITPFILSEIGEGSRDNRAVS